MKRTIIITLLAGLCGAGLSIQAQENVVISEFMAVNNTTVQDEDGQYSDWIEIYNAGSDTVNLDGWHLTDSSAALSKWRFPALDLPPYSYLVVFASGNDRTNAAAPLHTNFRLDASGEYLALVKPDGVTVVSEYAPRFPAQLADVSYGLGMVPTLSTVLVPDGATASVFVPTSDIGQAWTGLGFDDSLWSSGPAGIGYDLGTNYGSVIGTDIEAQMLNIGSSAYLRFPCEIADPTQFQEMKLRLRYDDGFVGYLNGTEILRSNAPVNVAWDSEATAMHGSESGAAGMLEANFDTVTDNYTSSHYEGTSPNSTPSASVRPGDAGSTGQFLRLIDDGQNYQGNAVAFDQTVTGTFPLIVADFNFRITSADAANPADGFAFMLISTSSYGTTGPGAFRAYAGVEEPNYPRVFSIGFDLYPHASQNDVSAHWDGVELQNVTIPRTTLELVSGQFHHCQVQLEYASGGGAYVTVVITPDINGSEGPPYTAINRLFIADLPQYESRVEFAGRTGGLNMSVDLDNIRVQFGYPTGVVPFEEFDVSRHIGLLQAETNILAFHGLNVSATSGDFLILPELVARGVSLQATSQLFFAAASPGALNTTGVAEVVPPPLFSVESGIYTNSLVVTLSSTVANAEIHYTLNGTQPTESSPVYTTPISVTNSVMITARAYAPDYLVSTPVSHSYTLLDSNVVSFSSDLPLVIIDTFGQVLQQDMNPRATTTFTIIDTAPVSGRATLLDPPDYHGRAGVEGRGQTSWGFAKRPYNVEIRDVYDQDLDVSLLGMPAESDWILLNPYSDKTFMNNFLAFELHEKMGHYTVRRKHVEVFLNGTRPDFTADPSGKVGSNDYVGIYVLLERIKIGSSRVDLARLDPEDTSEPDITGGYIWKKDKDSPGDVNFTTSSGQLLKYHDPTGDELTDLQKDWLLNHLNEFESVLYGPDWRDPINGYDRYINVDSFVDNHWIVEFSKQIDGYRLSNFMSKDRGGKIAMEPIWDWNLSFGNANYLEGGLTNGWYWPLISADQHIWLRRLIAEPGDPDFIQKIVDRWAELRQDILHPSNVLARVDQVAASLNEAQARDFTRFPRLTTYIWPNPDGANLVSDATDGTAATWHVNYAIPGSYANIIRDMKNWILGRYNWIDSQFPKAPLLSRSGGTTTAPLSMLAAQGTIYYTLDGSDPRLSGGTVSPNALAYTTSFLPPSDSRIVARVLDTNGWSAPTQAIFGYPVPQLAITEIMYHPAPSLDPNDNDEDFEFIELRNTGSTTLDLTGMSLFGGVRLIFPSGPLAPAGPDTTQTFDGAGTPYASSTLGAGPGALVTAGGPSGSYLQLISRDTGINVNRSAFDQTATGPYRHLTADFDFRAINDSPPPVTGTPTIQDFDNPGASYVITTGANGPLVTSADGGSDGQFMRITPAVNSLSHAVYFDQTASGTFSTIVGTFDFRIAGAADGMSFVLLNTATHGDSGVTAGGFGEAPNITQALGVGLDIYNNGPTPAEPNANHVSIHWNGTQVSPIAAIPTLSLASGRFHRAQVTVRFVSDPYRALVTVKITPDVYGAGGEPETLFEDFAISGVTAFQARVAFGARTGGANATHDFDNVDVQYFNDIAAPGGLSLVLLPAATFGTTGPGSSLSDYVDVPNLANAFAVNVDVHGASFINDVTLHWNGSTVGSAFVPPNVLDLDDGAFHRAHLEIANESLGCQVGGSKVSLTITPDVYGTPGTPVTVFSNLLVNGFMPADSRAELAGRSGGLNLEVDLDNLSLSYERTTPNEVAAGENVLVVANRAAFESRYGTDLPVVGEYSGHLDNNQERLRLLGPCGEVLLDFRYNDAWHPMTDGQGFSLVMTDPTATANAWNDPAYWQISSQVGGSPGQDDSPPPVFAPVVVNEVLSHSDDLLIPGIMDAIELYNPSLDDPADVGGWFLSDDFGTPQKYRIPDGTTILPDSYLVVYETEFNALPGFPTSFALSAEGDEVYLFSGDAMGNLTGYYHGFSFGAAAANVTFGRHVLSTEEEHFVAQLERTLDGPNAGPLVGPIVISEVMYHPPDYSDGSDNQEDEFIELHNITDTAASLYDPSYPSHTWRLTDAVDFQFPENTTIGPRGFLLVVSFDPIAQPGLLEAFRAKYGVGIEIKILGPYDGKLDNSSDPVELKKPGIPSPDTGESDYILVDKVKYTDNPPEWPLGPDGMGQSLHRVVVAEYGNDPINWAAGAPTPGSAYAPGFPPTITTQPASQTVFASMTATFSVTAGGLDPFRYQWRFNQQNLRGATNASLVLANVQPSQAGEYRVVVLNASGSVDSEPAVLTVTETATFLEQPSDMRLLLGTNGVFRVVAVGNGPVSYQWQKNGVDIEGATDSTFAIADAQEEDQGVYTVVVTDAIGPAVSVPAVLEVLSAPFFVYGPAPQTAVVGSTVVLSVQTTGTLPMGYRWRKNFGTALNEVTYSHYSFLVISNVQSTDTANYTVVATNEVFWQPGRLSPTGRLTVVAETDGDGLPDDWETANGLDPNNPDDAGIDSDNDGMTNWEEYVAGTDPQDINSYLRVESISLNGTASIEFIAVSNRTYAVQYSDQLDEGAWEPLAHVAAASTNRTIRLSDPALPPIPQNRYYRLATPIIQP